MGVFVQCPFCGEDKEFEYDILPPEPDVGLGGWGAEVWEAEDNCTCHLTAVERRGIEKKAEEKAVEDAVYGDHWG